MTGLQDIALVKGGNATIESCRLANESMIIRTIGKYGRNCGRCKYIFNTYAHMCLQYVHPPIMEVALAASTKVDKLRANLCGIHNVWMRRLNI